MNNFIKNVYIIKENVLYNPYIVVFRKEDINFKAEIIKEIKINEVKEEELKEFSCNIYKEVEILNHNFNKKREEEKRKEEELKEKEYFKHFENDLKPIEKGKLKKYIEENINKYSGNKGLFIGDKFFYNFNHNNIIEYIIKQNIKPLFKPIFYKYLKYKYDIIKGVYIKNE